jgi:photosystem II stability/assembly factor-like uncharacterized protein
MRAQGPGAVAPLRGYVETQTNDAALVRLDDGGHVWARFEQLTPEAPPADATVTDEPQGEDQ